MKLCVGLLLALNLLLEIANAALHSRNASSRCISLNSGWIAWLVVC